MRDWRSGIVTITVRDSRHREHDPILGVVPLRLSDILQTSSQVTRLYPLDGGIVSVTVHWSKILANFYRVLGVYEYHCYSEALKLGCRQTCLGGMSVPLSSILIGYSRSIIMRTPSSR